VFVYQGFVTLGVLMLLGSVIGIATNNVNFGPMDTPTYTNKCDYYTPLIINSTGQPLCIWSNVVITSSNLNNQQPVIGILNVWMEVLLIIVGLPVLVVGLVIPSVPKAHVTKS
jgi:hypothetical protein